jgi:hypothetical protein
VLSAVSPIATVTPATTNSPISANHFERLNALALAPG